MPPTTKNIAFYIHIPYCRALCHYCDFAKTAIHSEKSMTDYFNTLARHISLWLKYCEDSWPEFQVPSVFLGGGTPSMATPYLDQIMAQLKNVLTSSTEITIEANPEDISVENIQKWIQIGINRVSLGVQTFDQQGLRFMKRNHSSESALKSAELLSSYLDNFSIDLIYGRPGQTLEQWQQDLDLALSTNPKHLSCYNLTYESSTPLGRAAARGRLQTTPDQLLVEMHNATRALTSKHGFEHYEISNFAKPGFECLHNMNYWTMGSYVGVGTGAHGFVPLGPLGQRYAYDIREPQFRKSQLEAISTNSSDNLIHWETERDKSSYALEVLMTGMRTKAGINLEKFQEQAIELDQVTFLNNCSQAGISADVLEKIKICDNHLRLPPEAWMHENRFILIAENSLKFS